MNGPIAILFSGVSSKSFLLNVEEYRNTYRLLAHYAEERDIELRFIFGKKYYKNGMFDSYWKFDGSDFTHYNKPFKAKLVLLQTRYTGLSFDNRVNNRLLEYLCRDKYKTAQVFNQYSKKTVMVSKTTNINDFETESIIIKPQYGTDGESISVMKKSEFNPNDFLQKKFIVQELIDSSDGIPGIMTGRHELRLYIFNGKLAAAYVRVPAENSYLSNISQGATAKQINMTKLPASITDLKIEVDKIFADISPRLYTIDVMFENEKPWIVELNDMPGMPYVEVQPLTNKFLFALLDMFEQVLVDKKKQPVYSSSVLLG